MAGGNTEGTRLGDPLAARHSIPAFFRPGRSSGRAAKGAASRWPGLAAEPKAGRGVWGDDLISRVFGAQALGPQFSPNNRHHPGMVASARHPRTGDLEYKGSWVFWLLI